MGECRRERWGLFQASSTDKHRRVYSNTIPTMRVCGTSLDSTAPCLTTCVVGESAAESRQVLQTRVGRRVDIRPRKSAAAVR